MPEDACDNVHSQSRRMIMVSPEPGFWIHTVELPKMKNTRFFCPSELFRTPCCSFNSDPGLLLDR